MPFDPQPRNVVAQTCARGGDSQGCCRAKRSGDRGRDGRHLAQQTVIEKPDGRQQRRRSGT